MSDNADTIPAPLHSEPVDQVEMLEMPGEVMAFIEAGDVNDRVQLAGSAARSEREFCLSHLEKMLARLHADGSLRSLVDRSTSAEHAIDTRSASRLASARRHREKKRSEEG